MSTLLRLFTILRTLAFYRVDELLPPHFRHPLMRLLFAPLKLRTVGKQLDDGERLRKALEDLGPIFVKFGQLLSTRPDLLPEEYVAELNRLQDRVAPFPSKELQNIVETALHKPVGELFRTFSSEPLASASIAQVHAAQLPDGTDVVVKVVRPGIQNIISKDVALMQTFARLFLKLHADARRLRPVEVVEEYRQTIFDELDLMREAANASQLRRNFARGDQLYVPEVHWDYCRRNVMVMERIYGAPVSDVAQLRKHGVNIKKLAELGVEIFFTQVFEHNFFHADMHPGNVFVSLETPQDPTYIALDMAIIGTLSRQDQFYLARNMLAMFRRDYRQVAELHVQSGWVPTHTSIGAFEAAIRTVCEPVFEKPIKDISFGDALVTLFQTARRFDMPIQPQLVLLQKTLVNIEGLGRQLYPELDLWATAHPYLERWLKRRFHPKTLYKDLKRQAPEWVEKFPEAPPLIFDTLSGLKKLGETAPALQAASQQLSRDLKLRRIRRRRQAIAAIAFIAAGYWAWPQLSELGPETLSLLAIGVLALILS